LNSKAFFFAFIIAPDHLQESQITVSGRGQLTKKLRRAAAYAPCPSIQCASQDQIVPRYKAASGSRAALPPPRPLRTVRAFLNAHGSSISNALRNKTRFPNRNPTAMNLPVAIRV
jgi:hypothetical protein